MTSEKLIPPLIYRVNSCILNEVLSQTRITPRKVHSTTKAELRQRTTHVYQCQNVLIEYCDIRSPYKPVPAPSTDGIDIDVCKNVTIRHCYISVNDDAVCINRGKGPDAHKRRENGIVEDILIEDCKFGESHGLLHTFCTLKKGRLN